MMSTTMRSSFFLLLCGLLSAFVPSAKAQMSNMQLMPIQKLTPETFGTMVASGQLPDVIADIRSQADFDAGHFPGATRKLLLCRRYIDMALLAVQSL